MDAILAAVTVHQRKQVLDRMANGLGLHDAYKTTLNRIRQQDEIRSKLGMDALMWLSRCKRPLQPEELRHALGVELGTEDFSIDNIPSIKAILGCTLGLVTIDEKASMIRLLHLTLQEYLGGHPTLFVTARSMMAEICLTYLNYRSVRKLHPDLDKAQVIPPFLEYATCFWGTHGGREVNEPVKSLSLRLLGGYEKHVSAAILWRKKLRGLHFGEDVHGISGLHCIAFWGIGEIAITMLEKRRWDVNGRDSRGDTPLMWAVRYGNNRVVELLLEQGDIRPDIVIRDGRTVFSFAAESGSEGAVKLFLLRKDVNPNALDDDGRTPLSYATSRGHKGIVELLLCRRDLNPNLSDDNGRTPLLDAASRGCESVVELLLGRGDVNPNLSDDIGRTPLLDATWRGHEGVVNLLLSRGDVNPDISDSKGQTPLSCAASRGYEGIVKLLLGRGDVNLNSFDSDGRSPLSYAAAGRHKSVVMLLVESWSVGLCSSDSDGLTPLSYAAQWGREDIVKLF